MTRRRNIPTKAELIQLQKLYKTDEKIGERLGGVPAYLVAYWRRKKHVPRHSMPKFSEKEVKSLWERFGDDDRCGLELGISKAAFYNWRRRYGIREKPAFLKLEQLELNLPGLKQPSPSASLWGKQTVAQKILARTGGQEKVEAGQTIEVEPDLAIAGDGVGGIIEQFSGHGGKYVFDPGKIIINLVHPLGADGTPSARAYIREFAGRQRMRNCYDYPEGSCHQVVMEQGHMLPGHLVVGTMPDVAAVGCLAGFGSPISADAMAGLWATGKVPLEVPATIRIDIGGRKSRGVYARDIVLSVIKRLTTEECAGKAIEFYGSSISQMSVSERFTVCNLSMTIGARVAVCPFDAATRRYLTGRVTDPVAPVLADKDAVYDDIYQINIDHLTPQVACPDGPANIKAVSEVESLPVNVIVLGTCANGRFDDLRVAAEILRGNKVHPDCRMLVQPASRITYLEALRKGLIRILAEAGAVILPPGYGNCSGPSWVQLGAGERALTTGNDNAPGCLGAEEAEVYLCSPATAAASAINAAITDPTRYGR